MTGGRSATSETITVLLDAQGRALTKSFRWLGDKLVKGTYPNASEFKAVKCAVDGIASLAEALDAIVSDGHAAVHPGRAQPVLPAERLTDIPPLSRPCRTQAARRLAASPETRSPEPGDQPPRSCYGCCAACRADRSPSTA